MSEVPAAQTVYDVGFHPYVCFHTKKGRLECYAKSSLDAQKWAGRSWFLKPNKWHEVTVVLADKPINPSVF